MTSLSSRDVHVIVMMPVLNDWSPARAVLTGLDAAFASPVHSLSVLFVDDGSIEPVPPSFSTGSYAKIQGVSVLKLKRNVGHQRAIAVGLCHISEKMTGDVIVVMDSDGQDNPSDALRLVEELARLGSVDSPATPIVFAERTRRAESFDFRFAYHGYRFLHYLLTGRSIRFGNFSAIPSHRLAALTIEPKLWNHYAASVVGARAPFTTLPTHRAGRLIGKSRLNWIDLVTHGLSALSCYNEIIGVRLLILSSVLFAASLLGVLVTIAIRLFTQIPLPGWTSLFAGLLVIFLLQVVTLASIFTMQMISTRSVQPFLPIRDYRWYVDGVTCCYSS